MPIVIKNSILGLSRKAIGAFAMAASVLGVAPMLWPISAVSPLPLAVTRVNRGVGSALLAVALAEEQVAAAEREIAAGQRAPVASDSYLEVGDFIRDLSITYDWCASFTTASQRTRWAAYAEQAVWNVWNPAQARWGTGSFPWSGWSINDPGNNYHFSFLEATMYWSLASNSSTWRTFLDNQKFPPLMDFFAALPGGGRTPVRGTPRRKLVKSRVRREKTGRS